MKIKISQNTRKLFLSTLLVLVVVNLFAQPFQLSDQVPFDPATSKGVLKNGMTYYVKSNPTPKNRAEMARRQLQRSVGARDAWDAIPRLAGVPGALPELLQVIE